MSSKTKITVLGTGRVGSAIVKDLAKDEDKDVLAVDYSKNSLSPLTGIPSVKTRQADLSNPDQISECVRQADLVVSAVPGNMGFETLRQILLAGKNVVDISFFPEDCFELDELATSKKLTAVVDCGVAPGLGNILAGYIESKMDNLLSYACYVGGLPKERVKPYEYKAPFSPSDVIEEYTRPARYVVNHELITKEALTDIELLDFPGIGTLEAFNTDGLRSLIHTMNMPNMIEKTMRYPGYADLMRIFRDSGFFDKDSVQLNGQTVIPLELTSSLLFKEWLLEDGEIDFTVMRVKIEGTIQGKAQNYIYDLYDEYDVETETTSMARTTGYTCTIVARQILSGLFDRKGICPPEYIGRTAGCFSDLMNAYEKRNIFVKESIV